MPNLSPALKPHILVVDDDNRLRSLLRRYLAEQDFIVTTASNAAEAFTTLQNLTYDLMVLDVMMPGQTGIALARQLRENTKSHLAHLPILLLTARGELLDRIEGFEAGADDYLHKPFEPRELLLRIHAILRRVAKPAATSTEMRFGSWIYSAARDELRSGEVVVRLTDMEAGLMRTLAAEPGVALSRDVLAERSRTLATEFPRGGISDRTIDVQVTRLRRKIETDVKNPRYLVTVRGEGYMLRPDIE